MDIGIFLEFAFDKKRFAGAKKVCLPNIRIKNDNSVIFDFSVEYENQYPLISPNYVIGVDVGVVQPATVSVVDTSSGEIIYSTTLSRRVHGLANSIKKSEKQKSQLRALGRDRESALHRKAASRKKRELAILIGQEIARDFCNLRQCVSCSRRFIMGKQHYGNRKVEIEVK